MSVQEASEQASRTGAPSDDPHSPSGPAENVDRIREILIGPQMREYEQRFARIEERLAQESADLKAELRRRLDSLEAYTRLEVSDLGQRLTDSVRALERRAAESDERISNSLRDLRQSTFDRLKGILDDVTRQIAATEVSQNRHLAELRGKSIDRFAFASLLTEVAGRVRGEFSATELGEADGGPKP